MNATTQADAFAKYLVQNNVDPNEVAKSFTHLRVLLRRVDPTSDRDKQQAAKKWWEWLDSISGSASWTVLRSKRTASYYTEIRRASHTYLKELTPDELVSAFGWGVRMIRYYQNVPDALRKPSPFENAKPIARAEASKSQLSTSKAPAPTEPKPLPAAQAPIAELVKGPTLPEVGETFTNTILGADETAVLVEIKGFDVEDAIGIIRASRFAGRKFYEGNLVRVEVLEVKTLKSGRKLLELKPAKKVKKGKKVQRMRK